MHIKGLLSRYLIIGFPFFLLSAMNEPSCNEIKAKIEVFDSGIQGTGSIKIDLFGQNYSSVIVSLIGPKKFVKKDIRELEVVGLYKGSYTLVLGGRNEEDNFCQKHFEFIIR